MGEAGRRGEYDKHSCRRRSWSWRYSFFFSCPLGNCATMITAWPGGTCPQQLVFPRCRSLLPPQSHVQSLLPLLNLPFSLGPPGPLRFCRHADSGRSRLQPMMRRLEPGHSFPIYSISKAPFAASTSSGRVRDTAFGRGRRRPVPFFLLWSDRGPGIFCHSFVYAALTYRPFLCPGIRRISNARLVCMFLAPVRGCSPLVNPGWRNRDETFRGTERNLK